MYPIFLPAKLTAAANRGTVLRDGALPIFRTPAKRLPELRHGGVLRWSTTTPTARQGH